MKDFLSNLGTSKANAIRAIFAVLSVAVITVAVIIATKTIKPIAPVEPVPETASSTTEAETTSEIPTEESTSEVSTTVTTTAPDPRVKLSVETVKNDLRVKFYNHRKKIIKGYEFAIKVIAPDGTETEYKDDNKNGAINITGLKAGNYKIVNTTVSDFYKFENSEATITVKDKVATKVIDVADKVAEKQTNDEADIGKDVEKEVLKDTVKYVESSKKLISTEYVEVKFDNIKKPTTTTTKQTTTTTEATEPTSDDESSTTSTTKATTTTTKVSKTRLKDSSGNSLYKKSGTKYVEAYNTDYSSKETFYKKVETYKYFGWQNQNGDRFYYDENGKIVKGKQVIKGVQYDLDSKTGALAKNLGCDISKHNGKIDFKKMKEAGIQFVIIRCGYRGYGTGLINADVNFATNIAGARAAGIKVGIYFYSQAINEVEAVEEASYCVQQLGGSKLDFPIFFDMEGIDKTNYRVHETTLAGRTAAAVAFCKTVESAGYRAGVYGSRSWMTPGAEKYMKLDVRQLESYVVWIAEYGSSCKYTRRLDMWQFTESGKGSDYGCQSAAIDLDYSYYK